MRELVIAIVRRTARCERLAKKSGIPVEIATHVRRWRSGHDREGVRVRLRGIEENEVGQMTQACGDFDRSKVEQNRSRHMSETRHESRHS